MYGATAHVALMEDEDEFGLPVRTDWRDNAIGIDPEGCSCTDCLIGASVPIDSPRMQKLAEAAHAGRPIRNRTDYALVLVERFDGTVEFEELRARTVIGTYSVM